MSGVAKKVAGVGMRRKTTVFTLENELGVELDAVLCIFIFSTKKCSKHLGMAVLYSVCVCVCIYIYI